MQKVVFTDLDGTLLDGDTYSYEVSLPYVEKVKSLGVPIVFCTSKTKSENEYYQKKLGVYDPFIIENGGAIYIPDKYFDFPIAEFAEGYTVEKDGDYDVIVLGVKYDYLTDVLRKIRKEKGWRITGFSDMTPDEVARDANLSIDMAKLAKDKMYNESFKFEEGPEKDEELKKEVSKYGLKLARGGRYYNIIGKEAGKGKAVKILTEMFRKKYGEVETIGIGDSFNDESMLAVVDIPVLVKNRAGIWNREVEVDHLQKIDGKGPIGWVEAIKKFVL